MYNVRSARVAQEKEKTELLKMLIGFGNHKKKKSYDYCIKNEDALKQWYMEFYTNYRFKKYNEHKEQIADRNKALIDRWSNYDKDFAEREKLYNDLIISTKNDPKNELCGCGGNIRHIKSHDFLGCDNYTDYTQKHFSMSRPEYHKDKLILHEVMSPEEFFSTFEFSKLYIHYFKQDYGISSDIMQSILFEFLHSIWNLPKVAFDVTSATFNVGVSSSQKSKKEEEILYNILKSKFPTVLNQPLIIYDIEGDNKTKCFPDFICSNENVVLVLDVKKDPNQCDDSRLMKYDELVKFINANLGVHKKVITHYYFYNAKDYADERNMQEIEVIKEMNGISINQILAL